MVTVISRFVPVLGLALLVLGSSRLAHSAQQSSSDIIVTARRPLDPIAEARKLVADMERKAAEVSVVKLSRSELHSASREMQDGARRINYVAGAPTATSGRPLVLQTDESLETVVLASGLRAGVYTMWWEIFNSPERCSGADQGSQWKCGGGDGSDLHLPDASVFWSTGAVVGEDGIGLFHASIELGADLGAPGKRHISGPGLVKPLDAEIRLVIKYSGRASEEVEELSRQLVAIPDDCVNESGDVDLDAFVSQCNDSRVAVAAR